jgi:hypothetical protein
MSDPDRKFSYSIFDVTVSPQREMVEFVVRGEPTKMRFYWTEFWLTDDEFGEEVHEAYVREEYETYE